jgi:hypothetical protein
MRHPATLPPGSRAEVVKGAIGSTVVGPDYRSATPLYAACARRLNDGQSLITANCGFAIAYQDEVAAAVHAPVALSSLLLVALLARVYHGSLGVLTYDAAQLDEGRRAAAGWPEAVPIPVLGVRELPEWAKLEEIEPQSIDPSKLGDQLVHAARAFRDEHHLHSVLLECTAMVPFRRRLREELGVSVFEIVGLVDFLVNRPVLGAFDGAPGASEAKHVTARANAAVGGQGA